MKRLQNLGIQFSSFSISDLKDKHVKTVSLKQSQNVLSELVKQKTKCIMLFTSQKNPDGKEWCPYCVKIKPLYDTLQAQTKEINLPFYVFIVGNQATWKNPQHPFRKQKFLQVKSVPTYGYFNGKQLLNKLGGDDMMQKANRDLVYEQNK